MEGMFVQTTEREQKVFLTCPTTPHHPHPPQLLHAPEGPAVGCGWPLFRRLSRSVHRDATGSEGGWVACMGWWGGHGWSAQMACVHACMRARVL